MSTRRVGRRLFLLGTGGFTLAVPFLPSLVRRGEAQPTAGPKRFVAMHLEHGGVRHEHMWPADDTISDTTTVLGDHVITHGAIPFTQSGGETVLSPVLRAPDAQLTPALIAKMNLLRGLDVPWYCAHGTHELGNYGSMTLAGDSEVADTPTIDQVMAYSSSVYPDVPRRRSLHIGREGTSTTWSNPSDRSSSLEIVPTASGTRALFNEVYVPTDPGPAPRPLVVDRVIESYRRVRNGTTGPGARISNVDKQRLDDYMERLFAIQAALHAPPAASCADVMQPTEEWGSRFAVYGPYQNDPDSYGRFYRLYNDVIVAAFMCDSSRVAVARYIDDFHGGMDAVGGFHEVAHTADADPTREAMLQITSRNFFQMVYVDLISKLDSLIDVDGATVLDNSLVFFTNESGPVTHDNDSQPVVMAGGAGGALRTGMYVDYRNRNGRYLGSNGGTTGQQLVDAGRLPGLHYYQWLTTCLDAMGVPRSEWPRGASMPYTDNATVPGWFAPSNPKLAEITQYSMTSLPIITV
ncbi:MAG: DUF1552 domain-containing protein [Sandaracinaceae bacterium]